MSAADNLLGRKEPSKPEGQLPFSFLPNSSHVGVVGMERDFHDKPPLEAIVQGSVVLYNSDPTSVIPQVLSGVLKDRRFLLTVEYKQNPKIDDIPIEDIPHYDVYVVDATSNYITEEGSRRIANFAGSIKEKYPYSGVLILGTQAAVYSKPAYEPIRRGYRQLGTIDEIMANIPSSESGLQRYFGRGLFMDSLTRLSMAPLCVKFGGSIIDLAIQYPKILHDLVEEFKKKHDEGYLFIFTVGLGPGQSTNIALSTSDRWLEEQSIATLKRNATMVRELFGSLGADAVYVDPASLDLVQPSRSYLQEKIPIVLLSDEPGIPASESDVHTLSIAEKYGIRRGVLFVKDTNGVYKWDPHISPEMILSQEDLERSYPKDLAALLMLMKEENRFYRTVTAQELLDGMVSRVGIDLIGNRTILTPNHLIETNALERFVRSDLLELIHIVDGKKPSEVGKAVTREEVTGTYVIKGRYAA